MITDKEIQILIKKIFFFFNFLIETNYCLKNFADDSSDQTCFISGF